MESPVPTPAEPDAPDAPDEATADEAAAADAPDGPGTPVAAEPPWRFMIRPRWVAWHVFTVVAVWGMLWLGDWQLRRALAGNGLSWAYTFEWPLFAGFGIVFWARTIRDEFRERRGDHPAWAAAEAAAAKPALPDGVGSQQAGETADDADDTELASYNAYLARLNAEVKGHGKWRGFR